MCYLESNEAYSSIVKYIEKWERIVSGLLCLRLFQASISADMFVLLLVNVTTFYFINISGLLTVSRKPF